MLSSLPHQQWCSRGTSAGQTDGWSAKPSLASTPCGLLGQPLPSSWPFFPHLWGIEVGLDNQCGPFKLCFFLFLSWVHYNIYFLYSKYTITKFFERNMKKQRGSSFQSFLVVVAGLTQEVKDRWLVQTNYCFSFARNHWTPHWSSG